jgi:hypothetical protein
MALRVTPVPIPNTMVKLQSADGTAGVALWKSRSSPGSKTLSICLVFFIFCYSNLKQLN